MFRNTVHPMKGNALQDVWDAVSGSEVVKSEAEAWTAHARGKTTTDRGVKMTKSFRVRTRVPVQN